MTTLTILEARVKLYGSVDTVASEHKPIIIKGKRASAVLVSEHDWEAIQETLYLTSIPGMRESIKEGLVTPAGECSEELDW
ncbi:MAG: type II toxin-antitoxin system Phd/YefM family antitoxin [Proteobacteria bacterium]|nr:type II toxin-antitoxin system Phd/YefM family antitoxin [Pseudomonadota bacterium]MBU1689024.1 type II toxin-antitoxin system Phd/YefM family antitoxin [Pseudomonadota bacterium]